MADIIITVKIIVKTCDGIWGSKRLIEAAIALISAPAFIVFAISRRKIIGITTLLEYLFLIMADMPLPVKSPILVHISWITVIKGYWNSASHSILYPNCAPACENVAIPDGSSSEAPVIKPGPKDFKKDLNDNYKKRFE